MLEEDGILVFQQGYHLERSRVRTHISDKDLKEGFCGDEKVVREQQVEGHSGNALQQDAEQRSV